MNIRKIAILTAILVVPICANAQTPLLSLDTSLSPLGSPNELHNNAHQSAGAQQMYDAWKSNKSHTLDPFKRISNGYTAEYGSQNATLAETLLSDSYSESVIAINEFVKADIALRKSNRDEGFSSAYSMSNSDEGFNTDLYNEEISAFRAERLNDSELHYENLKQLIASHSVSSSTSIDAINVDNGQKTYSATVNILSLMDNEISSNKNDLLALFEDNLIRVGDATAQSAETAILAAAFSSDCPACTSTPAMPVAPVTGPPPPPPVTTPPIYNPPIDDCGIIDGGWAGSKGIYYKCP